MVSALISRFVILIFGTLYPAYASYKAIRTKNVKEYVKWMMYWIVFAFFTTFETFADGLLSWLPFYYEIKIVFVLWLLSPITKGSSFLYRKFVHPQLTKREKEIDEYISQARNKGYTTVLRLGSRGFSYATNVILQTAIQGQSKLVSHLRRSYSMSDISSDLQDQRSPDRRDRSLSIPESEDELDNRLIEDNEELEKRALKKEALSQLDDEGDNLATSHKTELYSVPEESIMEPAAASKIYDQDITRKYHGYFGSLRGYDLRSYSKKEVKEMVAQNHNFTTFLLPFYTVVAIVQIFSTCLASWVLSPLFISMRLLDWNVLSCL